MKGRSMPNYMAEQSPVVRIETDELKCKLNRLYKSVRTHRPTDPSAGKFDYLWDIKELALLEQQPSVEIPCMWLEELEYQIVKENRLSLLRH